MQQPETNVSSKQRVDEIDRARAQEYALIATLLSRSPDTEMIGRLALLRGDASPLGAAHAGLGEAARGANEDDLAQEYFDLFAGLGGGALAVFVPLFNRRALRTPARATTRNPLASWHRKSGRAFGTGGSCRDPLRNHGRACRWRHRSCCRCRSCFLWKTPRA